MRTMPKCAGGCHPADDGEWVCESAGGTLLANSWDLPADHPAQLRPFGSARVLGHWPMLGDCPDCLECYTAGLIGDLRRFL